ETERRQELNRRVRIGDPLAHQVLARDPDMGGAARELRYDLAGRYEQHLDPVEPAHAAAVVARTARLHQIETGAREEGRGVLLQPSLGGDGEHQRGLVHAATPSSKRSSQSAQPTAGTGRLAP